MNSREEAFLLDLLNSTPVVDGTQQDLLGTATAGRSWLRTRGGTGSKAEWEVTRATRDALQSVVRGSDPAVLAPFLHDVCHRPSIEGDGVQWELVVGADRTRSVQAILTWDALRTQRPGRLRPCENPECGLFLIDRSKSGSARWCSMAVCGNRMKARRHYERSRG